MSEDNTTQTAIQAQTLRTIECYRDNFDSQLLGCNAYKLWLYDPVRDEHEITACLEGKAADAVFCFTNFHHANFRALQALGFDLISVRNTYEKSIKSELVSKSDSRYDFELVRASAARDHIRPVDLDVLADVIGATSRYYKDARIAQDKAHAVYVTWLNNSIFNGYALDSILAFQGERLVGIHTVKVKNGVGVIDLIGVVPDLQNAGVGQTLLNAGIDVMREHGASKVEVTTENENVPGSRFYQKNGFRLASVMLVWHRGNEQCNQY